MRIITLAIATFLIAFTNATAQYQYKIIVDINQIWRNELPNTDKIVCDGIWSIPGNSAGNKGRDIPIEEWQAGFNRLTTGLVCTEDYWKNFPAKNYDLTHDIIGGATIDLMCLYAEPSIENDPHETSVVSDEVIDNAYTSKGKQVIVLARAYHSASWKNEVDRALANPNVGGLCFEQKPDVAKYTSYKLIDGIRAGLKAGKKVFLLLPPNFSSFSNNYTADVKKVFDYLETNAPEILNNPNLVFVPNCYNRNKDKETSMYGDENSVEGAIKALKELREKGATDSKATLRQDTDLEIFPNPADETVYIKGAKPGSNACVYNLKGQIIQKDKIQSTTSSIHIGNIEPGIYIVQVSSSESEVLHRKLMVE